MGTVIFGFLSIFKKSKASSPFEALNSVCLSRCQSDVIPPVQMRPIPLHCVQSNSLFPIKQVRSLDLLDGTTERSREIPQKSRRTLMSLQEYEIHRGSPNQLKIKPYVPALAPEQLLFPIRHDNWLDFLWATNEFP